MNKTILALVTLAIAIASVLGVGLVSLGQQGQENTTTTTTTTTKATTREEIARWLIHPREFQPGRVWHWIVVPGVFVTGYSVVDADKVLRIILVQSGTGGDPYLSSYRLVVLDRDGGSHLLKHDQDGGVKNLNTEVKHALFSLDPKVLAADKIAQLGVERVISGK